MVRIKRFFSIQYCRLTLTWITYWLSQNIPSFLSSFPSFLSSLILSFLPPSSYYIPDIILSFKDEKMNIEDPAFQDLVVVFQSLNHVQLFVTPWTAAHQAPLSSSISQSLLKFMSIKSVMQSNHLILYHSLLLSPSVFPSIRFFSNESALHISWPKYWSSSFSNSHSNEYSGLISFRIDWLDLHAIQGTLESSPAPQFKSINSLAFSLLYGPILTSIHDYGKSHSFDCMDLCRQSDVSAF